MNVVGLIVEYNPLHNGHVYHFQRSQEVTQADAVVVVMSGNFLQRGEPALVNKWARTKMALAIGADLVFELPYVFSTQQARYFALGAISILHQLPFVTHLCFGSESGQIDSLQYVAERLIHEPVTFRETLQQELSTGQSYPSAYSRALHKIIPDNMIQPDLISKPNNILAIYYLIALLHFKSKIKPYTIKREKADYHDQAFSDQQIASATSIRKALFSSKTPDWSAVENYLPASSMSILQEEYEAGRGLITWEHYYPYILQSFLAQSPQHLKNIYEMEEGIEHRFKQKIANSTSLEHLIKLVKTKRYTWNRIQRMILHTFTQFTKADAQRLQLEKGVQYLRLLGYSAKGRKLLNQYKKELTLPLVSSIRKDHPAMLDWDIKASHLHCLAYREELVLEARRREVRQAPICEVSPSDSLAHRGSCTPE